jgi:metal-responsive CopG/Arc/MetJ family transcriptional regulator
LTDKYNFCYTYIMKTAISIPDMVYETAEKLAERLGTSRSHLYTQALISYITTHRNDGVTRKLNELYATSDSSLDPALAHLQSQSIPREEW